MKLTQQKKIIALMLHRCGFQEWFRYSDFMDYASEFFVGYEAPKRFSELKNKYPEMFEQRIDPEESKFTNVRFRFENLSMIFVLYPQWEEFIRTYLINEKVQQYLYGTRNTNI